MVIVLSPYKFRVHNGDDVGPLRVYGIVSKHRNLKMVMSYDRGRGNLYQNTADFLPYEEEGLKAFRFVRCQQHLV